MPSLWCVKAVAGLCKRLGKAAGLSALSTIGGKYLTSQVFLSTGLWTGFKQSSARFTQLDLVVLNLLVRVFYTFSPIPTTNTNLIKGL